MYVPNWKVKKRIIAWLWGNYPASLAKTADLVELIAYLETEEFESDPVCILLNPICSSTRLINISVLCKSSYPQLENSSS